MDKVERVAIEIAKKLVGTPVTLQEKAAVAMILRREYKDPRAMCSGCAGKTVHHTCGKEPDADQTQAYLDKQIALCARREAFEEAARIVGPDDALYAGPYPAEVCDVIAGVLLSRAAAIRALSNSTHRPE